MTLSLTRSQALSHDVLSKVYTLQCTFREPAKLASSCGRCKLLYNIGNACSVYVQAPGTHGIQRASLKLAAAPQSIAVLSAHRGEPIQGGALSSNVQKRRSLRRLRRQQAATAAAVAGAVAGVSF